MTPLTQARDEARPPAATWSTSDEDAFDPAPETGAHVAQTIDPAGDGGRTIVLTVDADRTDTGRTGGTSILDGGLDTDWVVPERRRRFSRDDVAAAASGTSVDARAHEHRMRADGALPARDVAGPSSLGAVARTGAAVERFAPATGGATVERGVPAAGRSARRADTSTGAAARRASTGGVPGRRTVRIGGTPTAPGVPRLVEVERRRATRPAAERFSERPDRIALWAVLLGVFLILVAAMS